jgi:hypothetical protein
MTTIAKFKKLMAGAAAATGMAIPLAAIILAGPASANTNNAPPDPCRAGCGTVHHNLNPQPLPPGRSGLHR